MIKCKVSDKKYIGSTTDIKRRLKDHRSSLKYGHHKNKILQNAWNKYGESSFCFTIVEVIESEYDKYLLESREDEWMKKENSLHPNGFNLMTAEHNLHTEIMRKKRSEWTKGRRHSEETKQKISKSNKGKIFSKTHCENIRKSKLGRKLPTIKCPQCNKIGATSNMRRYHFDNCGKPSSKTKLKRVKCPNCKKSGSIANMKRWHCDNCGLKMSDSLKAKISDSVRKTLSLQQPGIAGRTLRSAPETPLSR